VLKNKTPAGKKYCRKCQTACAAACKKCPNCEMEFQKKVKVSQTSSKVDDSGNASEIRVFPTGYESYRILSTVYVPAGPCPIKLKTKPNEADVIDWADKVRVHFLNKSCHWLLNHALCYYLRYDCCYDLKDKECDRICNIINNLPDIKIAAK
jgi:hypothetical protein